MIAFAAWKLPHSPTWARFAHGWTNTAALRGAGEAQQAAVGHGLNSARSIFIEEFRSMSGFRAAELKAQLEFVARLNEMAERLDARHTGMSWGIRLFWMYALLLTEGEADAPRYGPELERLGLLGREPQKD
jgi:hypothetical protein